MAALGRSHALGALAAITLVACKRGQTHTSTEVGWSDRSPHAVRTVAVNGVRLQVLDWGGSGDGLVFIHGLGDSPHAFDDIAPAFTDRFRVIAYARRSHGHSQFVLGPLDNATLVEDLRQLLDSLGIRRAALAGWSMAGNEISRFAELHPERTAALVYLDSGYDWSDTTSVRLFNAFPANWTSGAADKASLDHFRAWWTRTFWPGGQLTPPAEAEVRDVAHIGADGRVTVPTDAAMDALFASILGHRRDYARIQAPALAIYCDYFIPPEQPDSARAAVAAWNEEFAQFRRRSRDRLQRESTGSVRVHHLAGVQHMAILWTARDTLVTLMRDFLRR